MIAQFRVSNFQAPNHSNTSRGDEGFLQFVVLSTHSFPPHSQNPIHLCDYTTTVYVTSWPACDRSATSPMDFRIYAKGTMHLEDLDCTLTKYDHRVGKSQVIW